MAIMCCTFKYNIIHIYVVNVHVDVYHMSITCTCIIYVQCTMYNDIHVNVQVCFI